MNPQNIFKIMAAKDRFKRNHPRFASFFNDVISGGVPEGSVIEISVQKPGQSLLVTNMKVTADDLELFEELKNLRE